jgi:endoglucanase
MSQQTLIGASHIQSNFSLAELSQNPLHRRRFLSWLPASVALSAIVPSGPSSASEKSPAVDWASFKARFLLPEGRIVDTGNGGISHSEGQGIGMLAAAHFDDHKTFDRIAAWTNNHLIRSTDRLYAWRYKPDAAMPVDDPNNATDGDMLIAWSMFEAARKWNSSEYHKAGEVIADSIHAALVRSVGDHLVLLPAAYGFVHDNRTVVNPSYYVFPALRCFIRELPDPVWTQLWKDGIALLRETH